MTADAATTPEERVLRRTESPCPVCKNVIKARIVEVDGAVRMRKVCPEHGAFDLPMFRDASFYEAVLEKVGPSPTTPDRTRDLSDFGPLRGICLDLTQRCNLHCTNCFANANIDLKSDLTVEQVMAAVNKFPKRAPVVFLQGGEPTLHPKLPEIIEALVKRGCVPKLVTNGLALNSAEKVRQLRDAGLDWVFLQFDGFDDNVYEAFRGKRLLDKKRKTLSLLDEAGFSILLAVMIAKGYNLDELGAILNLAFDTPSVRQVSFLPAANIGRAELESAEGEDEFAGRTEPLDVIEKMEQATDGGVGRDDFLQFFTIAKVLFRTTGNPDYKPKTCFYPMILYRDKGRIFALNRLLNPLTAMHHPAAPLSALRLAGRLGRLDNAPPDPNMLWLCIEHFRELPSLDIDDARHCNKVFLDETGRFVQSCIYNNLYRGKR